MLYNIVAFISVWRTFILFGGNETKDPSFPLFKIFAPPNSQPQKGKPMNGEEKHVRPYFEKNPHSLVLFKTRTDIWGFQKTKIKPKN